MGGSDMGSGAGDCGRRWRRWDMIMGAAASTDKTCAGLEQVNQEALLELN
ncbi:hypothetical protein ES332_A10G238300v1 [Gossypium tomentosum]|uniref:Uncharacterized protein n=1 Tax=Gossypium tomentosum TaxID=34277 RepID=A0A5D2NV27_GOSTO|nr:hypothetical protein ES332_A10G238300v1 [Gossypium tomentosum]